MRRREFITLLGGAAVVSSVSWPLAGRAQQAGKVPRIGWLGGPTRESAEPFVQAFQRGLKDLGWVEGHNIVIEWQFAGGRAEWLPGLAPSSRWEAAILLGWGSSPV